MASGGMVVSEEYPKKEGTQSLVLCPTWHRPIFRIAPNGIEVKCKFCNGLVHLISREEIEQQWKASASSPIA